MAPQKSQTFIADDLHTTSMPSRERVPYTIWALTSGNQYVETVELKPKWNSLKRSQYFEFSLKPPMPGANRADKPDFYRWNMKNAPSTMKPVRYTGEWKGNVGGEETKMTKSKADWYRSSLDIKLNKKYLTLSDNIDLDADAEKYKRALFVADI